MEEYNLEVLRDELAKTKFLNEEHEDFKGFLDEYPALQECNIYADVFFNKTAEKIEVNYRETFYAGNVKTSSIAFHFKYGDKIGFYNNGHDINLNIKNATYIDIYTYDGIHFMYCGDKGKSYPLTLKNIYQLLQLANKFWNEYDEDYEYVDDSELVNEYDLYRDFFNILFDIIGKYYPFVKDIKKYLYDKRTEYVIPMKFEDAFIYHNWAEYFNKYQNAKKIHVKFNMIHPNGSYWLIKSISYIKKEDIGLLENFIKDDQCYKNKDLYYFMHSRESVKSFLCCYYKNKLNILHNSDYEKYLVLRDFIEMSFLLKKKISLRHNSFNKIQEEESVLATKYQLKNMEEIKIPQKSKFNRLRTILPQEFEWITQKKRLAEETQMQHNCVWSYSKKINRDKCAIYSYVENQKRYTIEFGARRGKYYIAQIYGVCNSDCPDNIEQYVKELIA